jgi:hypothetical protein
MAWNASPQQFAAAVLHGIGAPVTAANLHALLAWQRAEGGSARFNPFNTTQPARGATNYNSIGVRNYTSYQQGLQATIATLKNGHYGGVLAALHQGRNPLAVAAAVGASPWGTSGALMASILHGKLPAVNPAAASSSVPSMPLPPAQAPRSNYTPPTILPFVTPTFASPALKARAALGQAMPTLAPLALQAQLQQPQAVPDYGGDLQGLHDQLLKATS